MITLGKDSINYMLYINEIVHISDVKNHYKFIINLLSINY